MSIYKESRKKICICVGMILLAVSLCACADDTAVISPILSESERQELSGAGKSDMEKTFGVEQAKPAMEAESLTEGGQRTDHQDADKEDDFAQSETVSGGNIGIADNQETEDSHTISITISAAGDASLGNHHTQDYSYSFRQMYDQVQDPAYFLGNVYDIFSQDDMTIVNLEGTLTMSDVIQEGRTYNIKGDPEYVDILTQGSVEAVSLANNHRWDYGEQGSKDTVAALENAGIKYAYDSTVGIYETKGIRIGFVSVNEASQGEAVERYLEDGIAALKEDGADLILACCHWGIEREYYPEDYQRTLGQKCIDWGADLVLGHHPHVLQGVEEYQGKYIVYSLANFCFGANRNPVDKDTMIFRQTFTFVDGVKQEDSEIRVIPCSVSSVTTRNDYCPTPAEGEEAKRIIGRINEYSRDFGVSFTEEGYLAEE